MTPSSLEIEACLDRVALAIHKAGDDGRGYLPVYQRLEYELNAAQEREAMMVSVNDRLSRLIGSQSQDQKEAQFFVIPPVAISENRQSRTLHG